MVSKKMGRFARLRRLFPLLAFLALPLAGCEDSGTTPAGPGVSGPLVNEGTAGIAASAENSVPGGSFTIIGYFNDGNGRPVEGTPIFVGSEGDVGFFDETSQFVPFFSFSPNPSLTAANGGFSIGVYVHPFTPPGSYTLVVQTSPGAGGPSSATYLHLQVVGPGVPVNVTLTTSTPSVAAGTSAVFTVVVDGSTDGCSPRIEYKAEGAISTGWTSVPGTGQVRMFSLTPPAVGTLSVIARAFCPGSSQIMYSAQVNVAVTAPVPVAPPTVTSVTLVALTPSPYSVASGTGVGFTLGAVASAGCTLNLSRQHSGAGFGVVVTNPASAGTFNVFPTLAGTLTINASGFCSENPTAIVSATPLNITVVP